MANKPPSQRILLTNSFLEYYKVYHQESLNYLMERYSYQILDGSGIEFFKVTLDDENYIEEAEKDFLKYESSN
jgi:hypothetical protein